jgi:hypothetical protein
MVLATTFLAPPLLARLSTPGRLPANTAMQPGDGGIDDLVFGEHDAAPVVHPGSRADG